MRLKYQMSGRDLLALMSRRFLFTVFVPALCLTACCCQTVPRSICTRQDYLQEREHLIRDERALGFSAGITLSQAEKTANDTLLRLRKREMQRTAALFPPARSFLAAKADIDASPLMDIFRRMPKGAILHAHPGAIQDLHWLIANATYLPHCYLYAGPDGESAVNGALAFFVHPPDARWKPVQNLRNAATNRVEFDERLYRSITLGPDNLARPDVWAQFENCWSRVSAIESYAPVSREFTRRELEAAAAENVQVLELRAFLSGPTDLEGHAAGGDAAVTQYREVLAEVRKQHPDFQLKLIASRERSASPRQIGEYLREALRLRKLYPDLVVGFDLVNEEDRSHTLIDFLDQWLNIDREARAAGIALPYFFHAGESNWDDNGNLFEALLLHSQRIGHGLALAKHPLLLERVRDRKIAVEVCPISNQVLGYVPDLRNHPALFWMRDGVPVTLNPDDPGMMQATFSHDFYVAFMAWGLDLADLKQLAMNSLRYSSLSDDEKTMAIATWTVRWNEFIGWLNAYTLSLNLYAAAGWRYDNASTSGAAVVSENRKRKKQR